MKGTWQSTDSGGAGRLVLIVIIAAVLLGSGAVAAISAVLVALLITVAVLIVATAAGLTALLIIRARRDGAPSRRGIIPQPVIHQLAAPERPAIPQHLHLHFDGTDPDQVAEILRRQRPE